MNSWFNTHGRDAKGQVILYQVRRPDNGDVIVDPDIVVGKFDYDHTSVMTAVREIDSKWPEDGNLMLHQGMFTISMRSFRRIAEYSNKREKVRANNKECLEGRWAPVIRSRYRGFPKGDLKDWSEDILIVKICGMKIARQGMTELTKTSIETNNDFIAVLRQARKEDQIKICVIPFIHEKEHYIHGESIVNSIKTARPVRGLYIGIEVDIRAVAFNKDEPHEV